MSTIERIAIRTCPLCEAGCGLEIALVDEKVTRIRGDCDDVFSHGYICPKGSTLRQLHDDPDRLRTPRSSGATASWFLRRGTRRSPRWPGSCSP